MMTTTIGPIDPIPNNANLDHGSAFAAPWRPIQMASSLGAEKLATQMSLGLAVLGAGLVSKPVLSVGTILTRGELA
jgi:hypothetical protein